MTNSRLHAPENAADNAKIQVLQLENEHLKKKVQEYESESLSNHNVLHDWINTYETGPGVHKWVPYLDAYHRHFNRFRSQDVITMVEVGVQSGGSIQMWQAYFGKDKLRYYGVDVNSATKQFETENVKISIGDQENPEFWSIFKKEVPTPVDIFIDDGGHKMHQQTVTFDEMFWHVRDGGVYLVEDLHTSYWKGYGGGYHKPTTFIERSKSLIDTINAWHSEDAEKLKVDDLTQNIRGLHFYDSMLFIDKLVTKKMPNIKKGDKWIPVE